MNLYRQARYCYLRFLRLKGLPHELALGMALGIFAGMMPIVPFQTALAVALALFFRSSKITAALGTWISNPLNWYCLYYYSYKIGALVLHLSEKNVHFSSIMKDVQSGEEGIIIAMKILSGGSIMIGTFLIGGLILGIIFATPSYFLFLQIFKRIKSWRRQRRSRKNDFQEQFRN